MTVRRRVKKRYLVIVIVIILAIIAAISGKKIYDYGIHEYELALHPIKYQDLVEKYAAENGVDKYLLYAIIKTESSFDEKAESNVGARGLMQIMEETFQWIQYRLDDYSIEFDDMYTAESNIKYGSYLIGYLIRYFENETAAVAAYHAGLGSVDSWLASEEYSSDGKTLLSIPIDDTDYYVKKINKALSIYKKLYS